MSSVIEGSWMMQASGMLLRDSISAAVSTGGGPLLLSRRLRLESHSLDEVHRHMTQAVWPHALGRNGHGDLYFQHNQANLGDLSIHVVYYGHQDGSVRITVPPMSDIYVLQMSLRGRSRFIQGDNALDVREGAMYVIDPRLASDHTLSPGNAHMNLTIPTDVMERVLWQELGSEPPEPITFRVTDIHSNALAASSLRYLTSICRDLDSDQSIYAHSRVCRSIADTLVRSILVSIPNNYSSHFQSERSAPLPLYICRAEEFIRNHACDDVTLTDVVRAAGVSVRTLHSGFRALRNTSPLAYLKACRLDLAKQRLESAAATRQSVTDVALACGFSHLSKFARDYKFRFGESPSATLRRSG